MIYLHKYFHAYDSIRKLVGIVGSGDMCVSALIGKFPDGQDILISGEPGEKPRQPTIEELKGIIQANANSVIKSFAKLDTFIDGYETYDLTKYSDRTQYKIKDDKVLSDDFCDTSVQVVFAPNINNITKLSNLHDEITYPLDYPAPVNLETLVRYAGSINDKIDVASYIFRNINHQNGTETNLNEHEQREKALMYLHTTDNIVGLSYPPELSADVANMVDCINYIYAHINDDLIVLANYIDNAIPKLPLMRRSWAIG